MKNKKTVIGIILAVVMLVVIAIVILVISDSSHASSTTDTYSETSAEDVAAEPEINAYLRSAECYQLKPFSDGYAFVYADNVYYIIDTKGNICGQRPRPDGKDAKLGLFRNGAASFNDEVIDVHAQTIVPKDGSRYDQVIAVLPDGSALVGETVSTLTGDESTIGVMNPDGSWKVSPFKLLTVSETSAILADWRIFDCGESKFILRAASQKDYEKLLYFVFDVQTGSITPIRFELNGYSLNNMEWRDAIGNELSTLRFVNGKAYMYMRLPNKSAGFGRKNADFALVSLSDTGNLTLVKTLYSKKAHMYEIKNGHLYNNNGTLCALDTVLYEQGYYDLNGNAVIDLSRYQVQHMGKFTDGVANVTVKNPNGALFLLLLREDGSKVRDEIEIEICTDEFQDGVLCVKPVGVSEIWSMNREGEIVTRFACSDYTRSVNWQCGDILYAGDGLYYNIDNYYDASGNILFGRES